MSESSIATLLWVITGAAWFTAWRACARTGIRIGATRERDEMIAATRGTGLTPPSLLADRNTPRAGIVAMIAAALLVPLLYATSTAALAPIGTWWSVSVAVGTAGALASAWEGVPDREAAAGSH